MKKAFLLLVLSAAAFGQPATSWKAIKFPPLRDVTIPKVEETTLPNGMKVYLLENHELPTIRGLALVRTGNLFDPADKVGLAGLTGENIRAGGAGTRTGDQIDELLENIAASVESQIGESYGSVSFSALKENTDTVMEIFRDVLTSPAFSQDKIDLDRRQTRSGISRRNDEASGIGGREFANIVYGRNTPYGWMLEYSTIDNIQRKDVTSFYQRYFFPKNMILAVQGDFSAAEMKARIEKLFAAWTAQQPPVPAFPQVANTPKPGIYLATKTDVTQTNFALGQLGGTLKDADYPALEVMSDILGGGFKSRLFRRVRTELGYAYGISAAWGANYDHPGLFEITGSTKSASTVDTLKAVDQEVRRIRENPVTPEELESSKQTVSNSFVFNFDTPAKTLNRIVTYRYFGYPDDFIFTYQKAIAAVTRADIQRVAAKYIDPAKFVTVAVGNPKDFGKPLSSLDQPVSDIDLTIPEPKEQKAAGSAASLATGKALLAKAAEAMGGAAKFQGVHDVTRTSTMQLDAAAGGLKITQTEQWLAPSHFRQENLLPFGKVVSYSDGATGWSATPQGLIPAPEAQLKQITQEIFRMWWSLMRSDTNPDRTVNDLGNGKLEISDKTGHVVTLVIDLKTGLPASQTYAPPGNTNGAVEEVYADWQETSGLRLPRKITLTQAGKHFADVTVVSTTLNSGLTAEQLAKKP